MRCPLGDQRLPGRSGFSLSFSVINTQIGGNPLQIFPHWALELQVTKHCSRMVGNYRRNLLDSMKASAKLANTILGCQKGLGGGTSKEQDHLRLDQLDLSF